MMLNYLQKGIESPYQQASFDAEKSIYYTVWTVPDDISEEDYKEQVVLYFEDLKKFKPKHIILNAQKAFYAVAPELQEWINTTFFHIYNEVGLEHLSWVVAEDLFSQVSFEQTLEEFKDKAFNVQFFDSVEKAYQWVMGVTT